MGGNKGNHQRETRQRGGVTDAKRTRREDSDGETVHGEDNSEPRQEDVVPENNRREFQPAKPPDQTKSTVSPPEELMARLEELHATQSNLAESEIHSSEPEDVPTPQPPEIIEIVAEMIEIDGESDPDFDSDSALGDSVAPSSTVSLRPSVFEYHEENGRTYHSYNAGKYMRPNDAEEQDRLDLQHHLFKLTVNNKIHLAPLTEPHNVLDIGTGTGIWAIEFAQLYPSANVLGTDLSPIQPVFVPPNCTFEIDDVEEEWLYKQKFDYIHGRALFGCFGSAASVFAQAVAHLVPGGFLEMQDIIFPLQNLDDSAAGTHLQKWSDVMSAAIEVLGRPKNDVKNYARFMVDAGLVDIVEKKFFWATNDWVKGKRNKLLATWCQRDLLDGLGAISMAVLTRGLGWSRDRVELLLAEVRKDIVNREIHAYLEVIFVYGRKPF